MLYLLPEDYKHNKTQTGLKRNKAPSSHPGTTLWNFTKFPLKKSLHININRMFEIYFPFSYLYYNQINNFAWKAHSQKLMRLYNIFFSKVCMNDG